MSDTYVVAVDGLSVLRDLKSIPKDVQRSALQAVNKTAERARAASSRQIREEVNMPAGYLSGKNGRLTLEKATDYKDPQASITGRFRPTSLARYATGSVGKQGVRIMVAPGKAKRSRRMFLIRLPAGKEFTDTKFNLGLAIRLKPGETVANKYKMVQMEKGLYLLYGPSVNQVFASVAQEQAPDAADFLEREFLRLTEVNNNRG